MAAAGVDAILDLTLRKDLTHANWSGFRVHLSAFSQRNLVLGFKNGRVLILQDIFAKITADAGEFEAKWRGESDKERLGSESDNASLPTPPLRRTFTSAFICIESKKIHKSFKESTLLRKLSFQKLLLF